MPRSSGYYLYYRVQSIVSGAGCHRRLHWRAFVRNPVNNRSATGTAVRVPALQSPDCARCPPAFHCCQPVPVTHLRSSMSCAVYGCFIGVFEQSFLSLAIQAKLYKLIYPSQAFQTKYPMPSYLLQVDQAKLSELAYLS